MNNLKLHEAKRLHYGKYLYKLKIQNQLATIFRTDLQRNGNLLYAEQKLKELVQRSKSDEAIIVKSYYKTTIINPTDLDSAYQIYKCLKNSDEYMVRCETNTLIVYTNQYELLKKIASKVSAYVEIWRPTASVAEFLTNNKNVIVVNYQPEFPWKLTFGKKPGNKILAEWIKKNSKNVLIGNVTLEHHQEETRWIQGTYMYARNEHVVMLLQMIVGDNIARIDKLIYKADIDK
jgi:hypothetical protein